MKTVSVIYESEADLQRIKKVIGRIQHENSLSRITAPYLGNIGSRKMFRFEFPDAQVKPLVEGLVKNRIRVLKLSDDLKTYVRDANIKMEEEQELRKKAILSRDQLLHSDAFSAMLSDKEKEALPDGLQESGYKFDEQKRKHFFDSVTSAMNKAHKEGMQNKYHVDDSLHKLIEIAASTSLRYLNRIDMVRRAGMFAIDVCASHHDYVGELIHISNNPALDNLVNVKAAIRFAKIVLRDEAMYSEDIEIALVHLNTNWLKIAFEMVQGELSASEKIEFKDLVEFLKGNRQTL